MTIKEFANKYNIPYRIAYEATYLVKPSFPDMVNKEYSEKELIEAVHKNMKRRIDRYQRFIKESTGIINRMVNGNG